MPGEKKGEREGGRGKRPWIFVPAGKGESLSKRFSAAHVAGNATSYPNFREAKKEERDRQPPSTTKERNEDKDKKTRSRCQFGGRVIDLGSSARPGALGYRVTAAESRTARKGHLSYILIGRRIAPGRSLRPGRRRRAAAARQPSRRVGRRFSGTAGRSRPGIKGPRIVHHAGRIIPGLREIRTSARD